MNNYAFGLGFPSESQNQVVEYTYSFFGSQHPVLIVSNCQTTKNNIFSMIYKRK